jgi:peptide chain release factor 1
MQPEDISRYITELRSRFKELEARLADPRVYSDHRESRRVSSEHRKLADLFNDYDRWCASIESLAEVHGMLREEEDSELRGLIEQEMLSLEAEIDALRSDIQLALLPPDPNDSRNIIVEIRPAAGGDESALFAGDLYRLYTRYGETQNWKQEILEYSSSDLGGIKSVSFSLSGDDVYSHLKYESGVHRVQRIPVTESGGRIHTSTVTVSVLPEAQEVELHIDPEDLRIDVFRASGPGGQCVNTTDSAVRITHEPTGLVVVSQQEKSQHRNKEIAMRILRARLLEQKQREEADKHADARRAQVGSGDRSERIRTYNFPQNRITDHRYNLTLYYLSKVIEGELDILLDKIIDIDCQRRLAELNFDESPAEVEVESEE